jgi:hypothetical protein
MPVSVQSIIDSARLTLQDANRVTWTDQELCDYLTEAEAHTVMLKPDAYPVKGPISLSAGTTQILPPGAVGILDIDHNVVSKRRITLVDRELLDETSRFWPAGTQETDVQHWCADPRDPRRFEVTPPNNGTGAVEALYGVTPDPCTLSGNIHLGDFYRVALMWFVLHRAWAKNSKRYDPVKSQAMLNNYMQALGLRATAQIAVAPKVSQSEGA